MILRRQPFGRWVVFGLCLLPIAAQAQLPGFEIVRVTDDDNYNSYVDLNDCGQMVFIKRFGSDWNLSDLYLYDNGKTFRLTQDALADINPSISNSGTIVWARDTNGVGDTDSIMIYRDGEISVLARGTREAFAPAINDDDEIAWTDWLATGCQRSDADLMFYDGFTHTRLTAGRYSYQSAVINARSHIVATRYDFCESPWVSDPVIYRDHELTQLPHLGLYPQLPDMNDRDEVVWMSFNEEANQYMVERWAEGMLEVIALPAGGPHVDNRGRVVFSDGQVFVYEDGLITQVTFESESTGATALNMHGELALVQGGFPAVDALMMRRIRTGDFDLDGTVGLTDHLAFVGCMTGPDALERFRQSPTDTLCDCRFLDLDYDNDVDLVDWSIYQNEFRKSE